MKSLLAVLGGVLVFAIPFLTVGVMWGASILPLLAPLNASPSSATPPAPSAAITPPANPTVPPAPSLEPLTADAYVHHYHGACNIIFQTYVLYAGHSSVPSYLAPTWDRYVTPFYLAKMPTPKQCRELVSLLDFMEVKERETMADEESRTGHFHLVPHIEELREHLLALANHPQPKVAPKLDTESYLQARRDSIDAFLLADSEHFVQLPTKSMQWLWRAQMAPWRHKEIAENGHHYQRGGYLVSN